MREILFRGKHIENGEWLHGDFQHFYSDDGKIVTYIHKWGELLRQVFPETVGQYTGLTDKNGKKIFDKDIVKLFLANDVEVGVIGWSDVDVRYKFASPDGIAYGFDCTCVFEIIGNIHDNPELLKNGKEACDAE